MAQPLETLCMSSPQGARVRPVSFAINASTYVTLGPDSERHLHGVMFHRFQSQAAPTVSLCARAKQFSSFILVVGTLVSKDRMEAKYATIVANREELVIPLLLETIPSAKEFKDAISSLSPEQQRFCKVGRQRQRSGNGSGNGGGRRRRGEARRGEE